MRVLLDEGVPRRLALLLRDAGVEASAFPTEWRSLSDASVIERAEREGFTILITQDRNMPFQRPLKGRGIAVLLVPELDRRKVLAQFGLILSQLPATEPGRYALLGQEGSLPENPSKPLRR